MRPTETQCKTAATAKLIRSLISLKTASHQLQQSGAELACVTESSALLDDHEELIDHLDRLIHHVDLFRERDQFTLAAAQIPKLEAKLAERPDDTRGALEAALDCWDCDQMLTDHVVSRMRSALAYGRN